MSKVSILWFNFSTSERLGGPVSSGLSLRTVDLVDKEIEGHRHSICHFGENEKQLTLTVANRRDTYLDIKDIRHPDGSVVRSLKIKIFYQLLKETIKEHYQTFDFGFGCRNIAVLIDEGERFDDLKILKVFRVKLAKLYLFKAPIDMTRVAVAEQGSPPFFMASVNINELFQWLASVCPSLLSTFSIS